MKKIILLCLIPWVALAAPEVITAVKTPAFGIDTNGYLRPLPFIWYTNCGLWVVTASGDLQVGSAPYWDYSWTLDDQTNLVLRP